MLNYRLTEDLFWVKNTLILNNQSHLIVLTQLSLSFCKPCQCTTGWFVDTIPTAFPPQHLQYWRGGTTSKTHSRVHEPEVDVWRRGTFPETASTCKWAFYQSWHQSNWAGNHGNHGNRDMFLWCRKQLHSCTEVWGHSSSHPPNVQGRDKFYQAIPHISTASDKHRGEKARVQGRLFVTGHVHTWAVQCKQAQTGLVAIETACRSTNTVPTSPAVSKQALVPVPCFTAGQYQWVHPMNNSHGSLQCDHCSHRVRF